MKNLINLSTAQTKKMIEDGVVIIDVRTPPEWAEVGIVPTSHKLMFFDKAGNYDGDKWLRDLAKIAKNKYEPIIIICRTGQRTKVVGDFLLNQAGYEKVYHTEKGIFGWIKDNEKIQKI